MQFSIRSEKSRRDVRKGTIRTMLRSRVAEKQGGRESSVAISKYYDIVNPAVGEIRVHAHSRKGLCIADDCHFAAFSGASLELPAASVAAAPASVDGETLELAELVVRRGMQLVDVVAGEVACGFDCPDKRWRPAVPEAQGEPLLTWLLGGAPLLPKVRRLCEAAEAVLRAQPVVTEVPVPAKVFGDIHGQLRDMLLLFHFYGRPGGEAVVGKSQHGPRSRAPSEAVDSPDTRSRCAGSTPAAGGGAWDFFRSGSPKSSVAGRSEATAAEPAEVSFVFNGDWVDRGRHQLEVVLLLFALKVLHPDRIWLNRGNHEDCGQNIKTSRKGSLGFDRACEVALGSAEGYAAFTAFHQVFDWLPLAARIGGRALVLHGGLGGGDWTLDDLRRVPRPLRSSDLTQPLNGAVYNILWSDPLAPDRRNPARTYGVHPSHRAKHGSVMRGFGRDVTERFCAREQLGLIIRSHQFKQSGKGYELHHDGWLMRVFSARNYCGESSNDGGVLLIGTAEGQPGTLLVRPQNLERMARLRPGRRELAADALSEPYCPQGHLMQLLEPRERPRGALARLCGGVQANAECNRCGAEELQAGRHFSCKGCLDYELCLPCARAEARAAGPRPSRPSRPPQPLGGGRSAPPAAVDADDADGADGADGADADSADDLDDAGSSGESAGDSTDGEGVESCSGMETLAWAAAAGEGRGAGACSEGPSAELPLAAVLPRQGLALGAPPTLLAARFQESPGGRLKLGVHCRV